MSDVDKQAGEERVGLGNLIPEVGNGLSGMKSDGQRGLRMYAKYFSFKPGVWG